MKTSNKRDYRILSVSNIRPISIQHCSLLRYQNKPKLRMHLSRHLSGKIGFLPKPHVPQSYHHYPTTTNRSLTTVETLACGFVAGCLTRTSVAPLDVMKIVVQLRGCNGYCQSTSVLSTFRNVIAFEGIRGLWKGNFAGCCRLAPYSATKFLVYDNCKRHFGDNRGELNNGNRVLFGAFAGMVATLVSYPMELVRTRLIVQNPMERTYTGVMDAMKKIFAKEGIQGLYRGSNSALIGVMPFEGIQFACYEALKDYAVNNLWPRWRWPEEKSQLSPVDYLVLGSLSGMVAQTLSYPLDSIKKLLQAQPGEFRGMVHVAQSVIYHDGVKGLYRGCATNIVRIVPYSAVMFTSYEYLKRLIVQLNE